MSIIFVGSTVDRETLKQLPDASVAGNKMELGFVKGFIANGVNTIAVSVEAHGMYFFNNKPIFVKGKKLQDEDANIITVPYINLPGIKQLTIMIRLMKTINRILMEKEFENSMIVVYNTMTIFANPVIKIARRKNLKCLSIIADLPIQTKKNILKKMEDKRQMLTISMFDGLIPLTKKISEDFAINLPYCVVEAGCNPADYFGNYKQNNKLPVKKIVFSGTLNELSGIECIIDAVKFIESDQIQLEIYGDGPLKQIVLNQLKCCDNIKFMGRVTNEEMIKIQERADLLVCPRKSDDFTTKYTFPSKILEYICAGVPVLANRLPGIPDEYEEYINYVLDETPQKWADSITEILLIHSDFYKTKACKAKTKVLTLKSWDNQCKRVIECFNIL